MTQSERPAPCKRPPGPKKGTRSVSCGGGCRRGSHPRGERPSGSGTRAKTQQSVPWSPRPGISRKACAAAAAAAGSGVRSGSSGSVAPGPCLPPALPASPGTLRGGGGAAESSSAGSGAPSPSLGVSAPPRFRKPPTHPTAQVTKAFCSFWWPSLVVFTEYLLCVRWSDSGVE